MSITKIMKYLKKDVKQLYRNIRYFKIERKFNGKELADVQKEIQKVLKKRRGIYFCSEKTARCLSDNWREGVKEENINEPENLRFIENAVPVVLSGNENFAPYVAVMLQSLLENTNPKRKYHFIIFERGFSVKTKECLLNQISKFSYCSINFIDMTSIFDGIPIVATNHVSTDGFSRLFIPYWFHKYPKIIYLDSDMIAKADIAELYDLDIKPSCMGAAVSQSVNRLLNNKKYTFFLSSAVFLYVENWFRCFNSGVLVFDTEKFREKISLIDLFSFAIYYTNRYKKRFNDQDVLISLIKDDYYVLPPEWNYCWRSWHENEQYFMPAPKGTKIIHFNSTTKPWKNISDIANNPDALEYREYAKNVQLFTDLQGDTKKEE